MRAKRKALAWALIIAATAGGLAVVRKVDAGERSMLHDEALRLALAGRRGVQDALSLQLEQMKARATTGAALSQVRALTAARVDSATLRDSFQTERWWQPFRDEFQGWQLIFDDPGRDFTGGVAGLQSEKLVKEALKHRGAAGIIQGPSGPFAAAVSPIDVPQPGGDLPALVLARSLDASLLGELATRLGGAVLLSNGRERLAAAGPEEQQKALSGLVARESQGAQLSADGSFAAAPLEVDPGVYLWNYASIGSAQARARSWAAARRMLGLGATGILAIAGLLLLLLPRRDQPPLEQPAPPGPLSAAEPGPGPTTLPFGIPPPPSALSTSIPTRPGIAPGHTQRQGPGLDHVALTPSPVFEGTVVTTQPVTFGRYSVVEKIGQGGMADVYLAVAHGAENFRRTFVVKRLRPELARSPEAVDSFIDEARLGASLVHSNIIPVYDFGKIGAEYFLATEYIMGRDTFRLVGRSIERTGRALEPHAVLHIMQETLKALSYAHARTDEQGNHAGLVHRDVSPSNILVSVRGEVKLFDFGIVKAEGRLTQTQAGIIKGNPSLMPPEQARGGAVDARTDLYALALTAHFLLTGAFLYSANSPYELLVKAANGAGPEEFARINALPAPFPAVLGRALRVDPAERFQDAAEFASALSGVPQASSADMARLVDELFSTDFRAERQRFAAAAPPAVAVNS